MGLTMEDKLRIANSGGLFQETGPSSWVGKRIRKEGKLGVVTEDLNGAWRVLTVTFEDGSEEEIRMNNIGPDPQDNSKFEWYDSYRNKWYKF